MQMWYRRQALKQDNNIEAPESETSLFDQDSEVSDYASLLHPDFREKFDDYLGEGATSYFSPEQQTIYLNATAYRYYMQYAVDSRYNALYQVSTGGQFMPPAALVATSQALGKAAQSPELEEQNAAGVQQLSQTFAEAAASSPSGAIVVVGKKSSPDQSPEESLSSLGRAYYHEDFHRNQGSVAEDYDSNKHLNESDAELVNRYSYPDDVRKGLRNLNYSIYDHAPNITEAAAFVAAGQGDELLAHVRDPEQREKIKYTLIYNYCTVLLRQHKADLLKKLFSSAVPVARKAAEDAWKAQQAGEWELLYRSQSGR